MKINLPNLRSATPGLLAFGLALGICGQLHAAPFTIYSNDFESYTNVATSLADTSDADPEGKEWFITDDNALNPTTTGAGVQVVNYMNHSSGGSKSLLLRPNTEAQIHFQNTRTGSRFTFDFWTYAVREATSDRNMMIVLRGGGADINSDDYLAYRVDRATNSTTLFYYDGVGPGAAAWVAVPGVSQTTGQWQHHRFVIDPNALTFNLYIDDMDTPKLTAADLSRCEVPIPTMVRIVNEGNSADDGHFFIDDISLTVEGSRDLSTTFTDGFESYPARTSEGDDADPTNPWVTIEVDGTGAGRLRAPAKVQVVDSTVTAPHSGSKCLKLQYGQRAGISYAWGTPPLQDVQVTWWAKVPAASSGDQVFLRMSLYAAEDNNMINGDSALLGYGIRAVNPPVGGPNSLLYYTTAWVESPVSFPSEIWTEYRLITHSGQGKYTLLKNPSSPSPEVIADRQPMIGNATSWVPFMVAFSTSNGTNHPPVYIDDIEVKSLVANAATLPRPYTVQLDGTRFTNTTILELGGPIGSVVVDPRDNSTIVFSTDASNGKLFKAAKVASGNWQVDPTPLATGLVTPKGMAIDKDNGTLWWVQDTTSFGLYRLKWPWTANQPETVIADFGVTAEDGTFLDDDTFDVCYAPASMTGSKATGGKLIVMDRGVDSNPPNALMVVDPATTELNQTNYQQYLVDPTPTGLGGNDLVGMSVLPNSGEVVTLCVDGQISAVNGDGIIRAWWPSVYDLYANPIIAPASIATDPTTGRIWIADDYLDEIWSVPADGPGTDAKEVSFPLLDPTRPDYQIKFHPPGMMFAPNGNFLVFSDNSTANGGGRLIVLHNEPISIPSFKLLSGVKSVQGAELTWEGAGAVKYTVQRSTSLDGNWTDVVTNLTVTQYLDTNAPAGAAFYRVRAQR